MKLTDEQVKNWRNVLLGIIGPYALIMPKEDVKKMAEKFQEEINKHGKSPTDQPK